jgi:hypothetical protein
VIQHIGSGPFSSEIRAMLENCQDLVFSLSRLPDTIRDICGARARMPKNGRHRMIAYSREPTVYETQIPQTLIPIAAFEVLSYDRRLK